METQPCIKCKHYKKEGGWITPASHLCQKTVGRYTDQVTGKPSKAWDCSTARNYYQHMHSVRFFPKHQHIGTQFEQADCFEAK